MFFPFLQGHPLRQGYQNLLATAGVYPGSEDGRELHDFPSTGRKGVSDNGNAQNWWHKPVFEVGSYEQITNNLRYVNNPDDGSCTPAEFCGALYRDKQYGSDIAKPLTATPFDRNGTRVNYYNTTQNMMPFVNENNILY
jgi:hypothetical protein